MNHRTAAEWLASPETTAALARVRADPLTPAQLQIGRLWGELQEAKAEIARQREVIEACYLALPTGCDQPRPNWNVVIYDDDGWQDVQRANELTRAALGMGSK